MMIRKLMSKINASNDSKQQQQRAYALALELRNLYKYNNGKAGAQI
jgi:hypothetical protein